MSCTQFIADAINARLAALRHDCAVAREIKRNAFGRRWARSARSDKQNEADCGPADAYWDAIQANAQKQSTEDVESSDAVLAQFIAEHRELMGADWIGNDHGRLCWASYLGGRPIDRYYCELAEGHEGFHEGSGDEGIHGSWPQDADKIKRKAQTDECTGIR